MLSVDLWFTTFCREKRIGASLVRLSTRCVHATFVETKTIQKTEATTNGTAHHALIIPNEQNEINLNFGLFRNVFICWIHQASFTPETE